MNRPDRNLSAMFTDQIALLIDGKLEIVGRPDKVMQADLLGRAYGCWIAINRAPATGPWFLLQNCKPWCREDPALVSRLVSRRRLQKQKARNRIRLRAF
jgi:ABC-type cobalamin/Fe3+-siderophores transport system ATPase subunit